MKPTDDPLHAELPDDALLTSYLISEVDPVATEALTAWVGDHPARQAWLERFQVGWNAGGRPVVQGDLAQFTQALHRHITSTATEDERHTGALEHSRTSRRRDTPLWHLRTPVTDVRQNLWRRSVRYVGVGFVLGTLLLAGRWSSQRSFGTPRAVRSTTYATANGQRANITLSDGSTVALNVGSRLEVPMNYAAGNRVVRIYGEGLFTVHHHAGAPFTVVAGDVTTRVLGTSFIVRRYSTDSTTTVAVRDGKVAVQSAVLSAGEQAEFRGHHAVHVHPATAAQFTFATGVMTITHVPLGDAIVTLNRWYDADIHLGDPRLATRYVTGECVAGSVSDLQNMLEWTYNVHVVRDGRVLTLYSK